VRGSRLEIGNVNRESEASVRIIEIAFTAERLAIISGRVAVIRDLLDDIRERSFAEPTCSLTRVRLFLFDGEWVHGKDRAMQTSESLGVPIDQSFRCCSESVVSHLEMDGVIVVDYDDGSFSRLLDVFFTRLNDKVEVSHEFTFSRPGRVLELESRREIHPYRLHPRISHGTNPAMFFEDIFGARSIDALISRAASWESPMTRTTYQLFPRDLLDDVAVLVELLQVLMETNRKVRDREPVLGFPRDLIVDQHQIDVFRARLGVRGVQREDLIAYVFDPWSEC
jgi:hypothetical protein